MTSEPQKAIEPPVLSEPETKSVLSRLSELPKKIDINMISEP